MRKSPLVATKSPHPQGSLENLPGLLGPMVMVAVLGLVALAAGARWQKRWLVIAGAGWVAFAVVTVFFTGYWGYEVAVTTGQP